MEWDSSARQNIERSIQTICKTAIMVVSTLEEEGSDLVDSLECAAESICKVFGMDEKAMENYRAALESSKELTLNLAEPVTYQEAESAREMIYALCDRLDDPKKIMQHVRTATEMLYVWESSRAS